MTQDSTFSRRLVDKLRDFQCPYCQKEKYQSNVSLISHIRDIHKDRDPINLYKQLRWNIVICECGHYFGNETSRQKHVSSKKCTKFTGILFHRKKHNYPQEIQKS